MGSSYILFGSLLSLLILSFLHTASGLVSLSRREALRTVLSTATSAPPLSAAALILTTSVPIVAASPQSANAVAATKTTTNTKSSEDTLILLRTFIFQARNQLESSVPTLIQQEEWDRIRTILTTPPLSDLYKKPKLLEDYADVVGSCVENGDDLAVLQAREELQTHLRFLDMAVYNNVFNPIKSLGETGATKQLVASYYEDPIREYRASVQALTDLYELGGGLNDGDGNK